MEPLFMRCVLFNIYMCVFVCMYQYITIYNIIFHIDPHLQYFYMVQVNSNIGNIFQKEILYLLILLISKSGLVLPPMIANLPYKFHENFNHSQHQLKMYKFSIFSRRHFENLECLMYLPAFYNSIYCTFFKLPEQLINQTHQLGKYILKTHNLT